MDVIPKVLGIDKLWEYAASAVGAVLGPRLRVRRARYEAEATRIEASAKADELRTKASGVADALGILGSAQAHMSRHQSPETEVGSSVIEISMDEIVQRIEFRERKKLANIISVFDDAAKQLEGQIVPDHDPDHDWITCFTEFVQDVSSTELKQIWSRLLAGEIRNPGSSSLRTLHALRLMSTVDAKCFAKVSSLVTGHFIFYKPNWHRHFGDVYSYFLRLSECGLLQTEPLDKTLRESPTDLRTSHAIIRIQRKGNPLASLYSPLVIPIITLTSAGIELYRVTESELYDMHMQSLALYCKRRYHRLLKAQVAGDQSADAIPDTDYVEIQSPR